MRHLLFFFAFTELLYADGAILPGVVENEVSLQKSEHHVIWATSDYLQVIRSDSSPDEISKVREELKKCILNFPDEINDCYYESGTEGWTVLSIAAAYNDTELVLFLLDNGAYPFFASTRQMQELLSNPDIDEIIKRSLKEAQQTYNILEASICSKNALRR